jgi:hypothetical protein
MVQTQLVPGNGERHLQIFVLLDLTNPPTRLKQSTVRLACMLRIRFLSGRGNAAS